MSGHEMEHSTASQAKRYLRAMGGWVRNVELAAHLGLPGRRIIPSMQPALAAGVVERSTDSAGWMVWRMSPAEAPKPPATFGIDWPPGFVSQWDKVKAKQYDARVVTRR